MNCLQPELRLDVERHLYFWRGEPITSVTEAIKIFNLMPEADRGTEESMERGTDVHKTIELYNNDKLDFDTLPDAMGGYLAAWIRFCAEHRVEVEHSELALALSEKGIAGTIDLVGKIDGAGSVLDFKSVSTMARKGKRWWQYQTHLYSLMLADVFDEECRRPLNLILCADGNYCVPDPVLSDEEADAGAAAILTLIKQRTKR